MHDTSFPDRVAVLLSGGKDSAVAAAKLIHEGHKVYLFYLKGWGPEEIECSDPQDRHDAYRVADALGLPLAVLYWSDVFFDRVFTLFFDRYFSGMTPNPDTLCNSAIKFGVFANRALSKLKMSFVASGHYARIRRVETNSMGAAPSYQLLKAIDGEKDQSYFLYGLGRNLLGNIRFPMGEYIKKTDVPTLLEKYRLPTFLLHKRSTRNICFLVRGPGGKTIGMNELLEIEGGKRGIAFHPGPIVNANGVVIGEHDGVSLYAVTIGQRKGLGTMRGSRPYYVTGKDIRANTIFVDVVQPTVRQIFLSDINWLVDIPDLPFSCHAKIRTPQRARPCRVERQSKKIVVTFDDPQDSIAAGQACVLYDGDLVLGGGVIATVGA